jgi:hypothetical protein
MYNRMEANSACTCIMIYHCLLGKHSIDVQRQCKYFERNPNSKLNNCKYLGNWSKGYQECTCKEAQIGLLNELIKGPQ